MHLAITLLISSLLSTCFLPLAEAIHHPRSERGVRSGAGVGSHKNKLSPQAQVIAQRQHHVHRDLLDICISVDAGVLLPVLQLIDPLAAKIHLCLCLNDLNVFLDTDVGVLLARLLGSKDNLAAILRLLINTSPRGQHCTFPPHSHHLCVGNNPCGFECDPPYVQSGKTCVCPPPLKECNGQCGNFPNGCGSALPRAPKAKRVAGPITTLPQAQAFCKPSETVCGIPGRKDSLAFECVDTSTTLDSCGGCVTPHSFSGPKTPVPSGVDCGHLPGVVTSACSNSRCMITQCRPGWRVNADQTACDEVSVTAYKGAHGRRTVRTGRRSDTALTLDTKLTAKLRSYVQLVIDLMDASASVPHPPHGPISPSFNHTQLVGTIVVAITDVLKSHRWIELVTNVDILVNTNTLVANEFTQCGCVDALGLRLVVDVLVKLTTAALDIKYWCANHPPSSSSPSSPASDIPITFGLDDWLNILDIYSTNNRVDVFGLGLGLTGTTNDLLNSLGIGPSNVSPRPLKRSTTDTVIVPSPKLMTQLRALVVLIVDLNAASSSLPPPPQNTPSAPGSPHPRDIVATVVTATVDLLSSHTVAEFVGNINVLGDTCSHAMDMIGTCNCVDNSGDLIKALRVVVKAVLTIQDWCGHHEIGQPLPHPSSSPSTNPNAPDIVVIIGLDGLLHNLAQRLLKASVTVEVRSLPRAISSTAIGTGTDADPALLIKLRLVADIVLTLKDQSGGLPQHDPSPGHVHTSLIDLVVNATVNLLDSKTVSTFLVHLDGLTNASGLLNNSLTVDALGLHGLLKTTNDLLAALLDLRGYCSNHPFGHPTTPSFTISSGPSPTVSSSLPSTAPRPPTLPQQDVPLDLGLGGLVDALLGGLNVNADANVTLDGLLNTIVKVVIDIRSHSSSLPPLTPSPPSGQPPTSTTMTAGPHPPHPPVHQGLIDALVHATANLLHSTISDELLLNLNVLLRVSGVLGDSIDHCGCIKNLGLEQLVKDVDVLLDGLLGLHVWCQQHPHGNGGSSEGAGVIVINSHDLLAALGLGDAVDVHSTVTGLGPGLSDFVNGLLKGLGLGGR